MSDRVFPIPDLKPLIVSAPFGNYLGHGWATPTMGSFTVHPRPPGAPDDPVRGGRLWRVLRTVRYNPFKRAWRNKIGLRNPGIDNFVLLTHNAERAERIRQAIVSVYGFTANDWSSLLLRATVPRPLAVELNLSCPNTTPETSPFTAIDRAVHIHAYGPIPLIAKLPPWGHGCAEIAAHAYQEGIRCFHACNTIPSPKGGVSGKPLQPLALKAVHELRQQFPDASIIGGGGITGYRDAQRFFAAGADHVAIASCLFFPWNAFVRMPSLGRRLQRERAHP